MMFFIFLVQTSLLTCSVHVDSKVRSAIPCDGGHSPLGFWRPFLQAVVVAKRLLCLCGLPTCVCAMNIWLVVWALS